MTFSLYLPFSITLGSIKKQSQLFATRFQMNSAYFTKK